MKQNTLKKLLFATLFLSFYFCSFAQHFLHFYNDSVINVRILNIEKGFVRYIQLSDSALMKDPNYVIPITNLIHIKNFGIDSSSSSPALYPGTPFTSDKLKYLLIKDADKMERQAQKLFTVSAILSTLSVTGFVVGSTLHEPVQPNISNYLLVNNSMSNYKQYQQDSSSYASSLSSYTYKHTTIQILSGISAIAAITTTFTGVNYLLKAKRNQRMSERFSFLAAPSSLYIGYRF